MHKINQEKWQEKVKREVIYKMENEKATDSLY